ncbi:histone-lysine N-methyltransferase SETD1B-like isoform X2 [Halichondria panicea]|uniref:histone-lysine N-methyltransferase SETD1B-like isoform X2 n=1 Tax=Halichondria panicea TaxID=6063 RepID=UPI00312BADD5
MTKRPRLSSSVSKEDSRESSPSSTTQDYISFRGQVPVRKAPPEPPTTPKRSSNRPPVPPDPAAKKMSRGSKDRGHEAADKGEDHNTIDYRTATPQEVLEKQMTSVAQRMNANGEARKRGGGITRTFSPLTPIIQHLYSKSDERR